MTEGTISQLQAENSHLRDLVVSLSATLLRKVAAETGLVVQAAYTAAAARLFREAEECFRCARLPHLREEIAHGLQAAGNELMAKAVSIETEVQRALRKR